MRIAVCIRAYRILEILRQQLPDDEIFDCDRSEVVGLAPTVDVFIPTIAPIPGAAFANDRVKLVQQFGVGLDTVDIPAATRAGVLVANVPSVGTGNAESVAELAIAHMLMLSRRIPDAIDGFRKGRIGATLGQCLWGGTVTILGYGGIGEEIARRLAGFGMKIIAVSRHGPSGPRERDSSVHLDEHVGVEKMGDAVADADFVVVAAPATPENIGLVGESVFARMKPSALVINIARGPVIDYQALLRALREGRVAGAGLDVFWSEPFNPDDPLLSENVIPTPHIGGGTERSLLGIGRAAAENIHRVRRGELPRCCVNPEVGVGRLFMRTS